MVERERRRRPVDRQRDRRQRAARGRRDIRRIVAGGVGSWLLMNESPGSLALLSAVGIGDLEQPADGNRAGDTPAWRPRPHCPVGAFCVG